LSELCHTRPNRKTVHTVPLPLWEGPEQGDGGCSDVVQGLQYDGLPCAEPIREASSQPVAGRLPEAIFLCRFASREINPAPPFLLGNTSEACFSLLQGT